MSIRLLAFLSLLAGAQAVVVVARRPYVRPVAVVRPVVVGRKLMTEAEPCKTAFDVLTTDPGARCGATLLLGSSDTESSSSVLDCSLLQAGVSGSQVLSDSGR